jgi:hypothetical protein
MTTFWFDRVWVCGNMKRETAAAMLSLRLLLIRSQRTEASERLKMFGGK